MREKEITSHDCLLLSVWACGSTFRKVTAALTKNRTALGKRYVELFKGSSVEMAAARRAIEAKGQVGTRFSLRRGLGSGG